VPLLAAAAAQAEAIGLSARVKLAGAVVAGAMVAFLLAAPYTVLALPEFLDGFAHLAHVYAPGHYGTGSVIYLKHLRLTLDWVASILVIAGLAATAVEALRARTRAASLCVSLFPIAYFLMIADRSLIFGRYLLPILPFVALLAGIAIGRIAIASARIRLPAVRIAAVAALVVATLVVPAQRAIGFDRGAAVARTPRLAYDWIMANVPRNAAVAVEMQAVSLPGRRYRVRQIPRVSDRPTAEVFTCYDYVVASSESYAGALRDREGRPQDHTAYADLFTKGEVVATFAPTPQHPGPELKVVHLAASGARRDGCP
jgi:hypothetical protein